ncbi:MULTISPECIES: uroporphyrinogen-III C-methyltransferase [Pantoea]|jgi:uroporphyrin-III C-methyltransferase|uniref:Uroporphyrinogen-III C-methyltransferase n=1 Tax=Pantoea anthophila TaxID=470931 RepID=A0ABY2ZCR8_9GAMM|nr:MULTISPECIES: uroporphyrinogen-III C-methyltransferase [Pantoea]KAF6658559.1 uroporphyrinogen-III C-methyltransferase [Enterobacteriaceae bacterium EKM102V]TPE13900.1 uroporphyrinogen-III C-methyltransferase [Pantoea vagans]EIB97798.1 putative uroporphyrinogen III C-methyltransferase [Pantoea sp. Sc1]KAA5969813.1 uroporphyrinogen-III C-methyltransferase [Pantoea sp. M_6]KAA5971939.1 uroporphyrinogen-III C-methyltransferase [Pantoea sp. M_8]
MTEQKDSSAMVEETTPAVDRSLSSNDTPPRNANKGGMALGAVAIVIALAMGAGLYLYGKHQADLQAQTNQKLSDQLSALQQQASSDKQQLTQQLSGAETALQTAQAQQNASAKELETLREKMAVISGNDVRSWLLAQADYLVKLAGRKLWSDQDVTTAAALLKSADASLADMNDPSVMNVRRALTQDISNLSSVTQVDYDGVILKLNQLSNNVDNLRLADNDSDDAPMDSDGGELSGSVREWRQNLVKSWHNFMDDFITIRRRDNTAQPLLAPNQDVYLRENIRSRLLIAAQAVPRHQDEIYKQSIDTVSAWVRAWYDTNDAATKAFLAQLDELSQQNINMDLPDTLESQPLLEQLMQTRVRNLLAQPSAAATQQGG